MLRRRGGGCRIWLSAVAHDPRRRRHRQSSLPLLTAAPLRGDHVPSHAAGHAPRLIGGAAGASAVHECGSPTSLLIPRAPRRTDLPSDVTSHTTAVLEPLTRGTPPQQPAPGRGGGLLCPAKHFVLLQSLPQNPTTNHDHGRSQGCTGAMSATGVAAHPSSHQLKKFPSISDAPC